jgi:hypothetical protein
MALHLRKWSPRSDSNRRPSDYESKSLRPAGAFASCSGCSRQRGRPASTFLTCPVMAGGMTKRMTRLTHGGPPAPTERQPPPLPDQDQAPPDRKSDGKASRRARTHGLGGRSALGLVVDLGPGGIGTNRYHDTGCPLRAVGRVDAAASVSLRLDRCLPIGTGARGCTCPDRLPTRAGPVAVVDFDPAQPGRLERTIGCARYQRGGAGR